MEWTDIRVTVPRRWADTAEAIATGISGGGIYIEDYADLEQQVMAIAHVDLIEPELLARDRDKVIVHMYLSPDENPAQVLQLLHDRLAAAGADYTLDTAGVEQEDWENGWKAFYHAMTIGNRLAVVPSWETMDTDRAVLRLDPGMAFGTGTHETTSLCLEALDQLVQGGGTAEGVDIDPMCVRTAGENAALNGVQDKFTVLVGDLSDKASGKYDIICANIVANAILSLAPAIPGLLAPGGHFMASGVIDTRKDEVAADLAAAGLRVYEVREKNGWECFLCTLPEA